MKRQIIIFLISVSLVTSMLGERLKVEIQEGSIYEVPLLGLRISLPANSYYWENEAKDVIIDDVTFIHPMIDTPIGFLAFRIYQNGDKKDLETFVAEMLERRFKRFGTSMDDLEEVWIDDVLFLKEKFSIEFGNSASKVFYYFLTSDYNVGWITLGCEHGKHPSELESIIEKKMKTSNKTLM